MLVAACGTAPVGSAPTGPAGATAAQVAGAAGSGRVPAPAFAGTPCPTGTQRMLVAELFFGRTIGGGPHPSQVTTADWNRFAADTLARSFPDGFTARDAAGAWRDPASGRMLTEATKDVLAALPDRPADLARVRRAIAAYRRRFRQQSVGVLLHRACGGF